MEAGFELSEYWMPGLGGTLMWKQHAIHTAAVLNEINPHYIRSRPFLLSPGAPIIRDYKQGKFQPLTPREQLAELKIFITKLDVNSKVCFDHANNHWRAKDGCLLFKQNYEGYQFPDEKQHVLDLIDEGISVLS